MRTSRSVRHSSVLLKIVHEKAEKPYGGVALMRHVLLAELMGTTLVMLALAAAPAGAQTLGEVSAATGIHGTLARQGVSSTHSTLDTVNRSLARSTKPKDLGFGSSSGAAKPGASRSKPTPGRSAGSHGGGSGGSVGSWVTGASASRGSTSSAWLQGGSGWATGGGGGTRTPGSRRPRS